MSTADSLRPGRPRDPATSRAILDAAIDVLCAQGYEHVTMEAVAQAAGVSRPTIYRRHRDRQALVRAAVADVVERLVPEVAPADDPGTQVLNLLVNTVQMLTETPIGNVFRAVIPHLPNDPDLGCLANELGRARRSRLAPAVKALRAARALPVERDLDTVLDGLLGAIYFRFFITERKLDVAYLKKLVDALV